MKKNLFQIGLIVLFFSLAGGAAAQSASADSSSGSSSSSGNLRNTNRNGPANNSQGVIFNGSDRQAPGLMPALSPGQTVVSGIVSESNAGHSAPVTANTLGDHYLNQAEPPALIGRDLPGFMEKSKTERTMLTFSGHHNIFWLRQGDAPPDIYINVRPIFTMVPVGTLLANVSPEVIKNGFGMDLVAVTQDAANTLRTHQVTKGLGKLIVATNPAMMGGGAGNRTIGDSRTGGLTLGFPGLNLGGSIGSVDGISFPINVVSAFYLVGVPAKPGDPGAVTYDLRTPKQREEDEKRAQEAAAALAKAQAGAKTQIEGEQRGSGSQ